MAGHHSTIRYPVGDLGADWIFPSDHLPIGMSIGNVHVASWNILNTRFMHHILTNHQGLLKSLIVAANYPVEAGSELTCREAIIVDEILALVRHPTVPRSVIALQETGKNVLEELKARLPANYKCITPSLEPIAEGELMIYDTERFEWIGMRSGRYQFRPKNSHMTLILRDLETGIHYRFVQTHLPAAFGPCVDVGQEFAYEILANFDPNAVTILMGDMNKSPDLILKDFMQVAARLGFPSQPFNPLWIPYPTHIDTQKYASWIDNLFYYTPYPDLEIKVSSSADCFFPELASPLNLLGQLRPAQFDFPF